LLRDNAVRDRLYQMTPPDATPADKKAFVDEALERLKNGTDPATAKVKVKVSQDTPDEKHVRLTKSQASALIDAPGVESLMGLRDTAMIALMLCTGLREMELCKLDVKDLRQSLGGKLALHVREGKGCKERLVPYGQLDFCLAYVEAWLQDAGITSGAVFRGFWKDAKSVRPGRLTVRAVNQMLDRYPISIDGQARTVNPHDCRRTYARRLYEADVDLLAIQQNLGHADHKTTLKYIGELDAGYREPPAVYKVDLSKLEKRRLIA
jgi:integrase/recombinase XerD